MCALYFRDLFLGNRIDSPDAKVAIDSALEINTWRMESRVYGAAG